jgi:DNA-binding CsgD family transcriptional regulator
MVDGLRPVILQLPYAAKRPPTRRQRACSYVLTDREKRMLIGVAMGHQSAEIGAMLGISPQTVKTYLGNAYAALGARNAAHAVAIALRIGILTTADITAQG